MALHELATNAGKYGALSTESGRVELGWDLSRRKLPRNLRDDMARKRGAACRPANARGFGSTVICELAESGLKAQVQLEYHVNGLFWRLQCPAAEISDGGFFSDRLERGSKGEAGA